MQMIFSGRDIRQEVERSYRSVFYKKELAEVVKNPEFSDVLVPFMTHMRTRVINEVYRLNPSFMWELMARKKDGGKEYGPLDWRHSSSHAFYWTNLGVKRGLARKHKEGFDMQNLYRDMIHATQELRNTGRIFFDPNDIESYSTVPMLEAVNAYIEIYNEGRRLATSKEINAKETTYMQGYENYLARSSVLAYTWGDIDLAKKLFLKAKSEFEIVSERTGDPILDRYHKSLEEFIVEERITSWMNKANVESDIKGVMFAGFVKIFKDGNQKQYNKNMSDAKQLYKRYMDKQGDTEKIGIRERMGLKPLADLKADSFKIYFSRIRSHPYELLDIWRFIDKPTKLRSYADLRFIMRDTVQQVANMTGKKLEVDKMFPQPAGLRQFLQKRYDAAKLNQSLDKGIQKK